MTGTALPLLDRITPTFHDRDSGRSPEDNLSTNVVKKVIIMNISGRLLTLLQTTPLNANDSGVAFPITDKLTQPSEFLYIQDQKSWLDSSLH